MHKANLIMRKKSQRRKFKKAKEKPQRKRVKSQDPPRFVLLSMNLKKRDRVKKVMRRSLKSSITRRKLRLRVVLLLLLLLPESKRRKRRWSSMSSLLRIGSRKLSGPRRRRAWLSVTRTRTRRS